MNKYILIFTLLITGLFSCVKQDIPVCKTCHYEISNVVLSTNGIISTIYTTDDGYKFTACDDWYLSINNKVDTLQRNYDNYGLVSYTLKRTLCKY